MLVFFLLVLNIYRLLTFALIHSVKAKSAISQALVTDISYANASFYGCSFASYQDTWYTGRNASTYVVDSIIYGQTDCEINLQLRTSLVLLTTSTNQIFLDLVQRLLFFFAIQEVSRCFLTIFFFQNQMVSECCSSEPRMRGRNRCLERHELNGCTWKSVWGLHR